MTNVEKKEILKKAEDFFRNTIAINHLRSLEKLKKLKEFNVNPFTVNYLAHFLTGKGDAESIAKALIYPRILGTSITTILGTNFQTKFISEVLGAVGTVISGTDVEFIDQIDGRKKYAQIKAGPDTLNHDDVNTIKNHFRDIKNLARQNGASLGVDDLILGVLYGTPDVINAFYKKVAEDYPVYVGEEFWHRLTGDENFYVELVKCFGKVAKEIDAKDKLEETIKELAKEIQKELLDKELKAS